MTNEPPLSPNPEDDGLSPAPPSPGAELEPAPAAPPMAQSEPGDQPTVSDPYSAHWQAAASLEAPAEGVFTTVPKPRRRSALPGILIALLALGMIAVTLWAVKLHRDRALMTGAVSRTLNLMGEGAPPEVAKQVQSIQADLAADKMNAAVEGLDALRLMAINKKPTKPADALAGEAPLSEEAYNGLPPDAAHFFRENQDLLRRFLMLCDHARQMRDAGKDVAALRTVRDEIIEAARLGQMSVVQAKMMQMLRMEGGLPPSGPASGEGVLREKADRLKTAAQAAERQGKDLRAVFALMQEAEFAAQNGDLTGANKLLDKALTAVKSAPRAQGPMGAGPRPGVRGQNPLAGFVQALLGVMGAEEQNLKAIADNLRQAKAILLGSTPAEQQPAELTPLVDSAMGQLKTMAARRQELTRQMNAGPGGRPGRAASNQSTPPGMLTPQQRQTILALVQQRIGEILDRIRTMPEQDYAKNRKTLIREILQTVFEPPQPQPQAPAPKPLKQADRIRAKMVQASPVLRKQEIEGKDTKHVEELFTQARTALYANKLDTAEKLVDEAMNLLGLTLPASVPPAPALEDNSIKLDLRSRPNN